MRQREIKPNGALGSSAGPRWGDILSSGPCVCSLPAAMYVGFVRAILHLAKLILGSGVYKEETQPYGPQEKILECQIEGQLILPKAAVNPVHSFCLLTKVPASKPSIIMEASKESEHSWTRDAAQW